MFNFGNSDPSSAFKHVLANSHIRGRYHIDPMASPYILPNDLEENKRLDLQHYLMHQILQSNAIAPIGQPQQISTVGVDTGSWNYHILGLIRRSRTTMPVYQPQRILDVGCGTGRWAIEIARQFPASKVIGIDIVEPVHPYTDRDGIPANFTFQLGNILQGIPFADGYFDYIHMRFLNFGIPANKWQATINELARLTAPGGWIESIELVLPHSGGPLLTRSMKAFEKTLMARSIDLACSRNVDDCMRQATPRLSAIQSQLIEIPIGPHGEAIGIRMAWNISSAIHNMGYFFQQAHLFQTQEWQTFMDELDNELNSVQYEPMLPIYLVTSQRNA
jgi:ubiquinone/menaquinone biosynthesis C-methylase UbiE